MTALSNNSDDDHNLPLSAVLRARTLRLLPVRGQPPALPGHRLEVRPRGHPGGERVGGQGKNRNDECVNSSQNKRKLGHP